MQSADALSREGETESEIRRIKSHPKVGHHRSISSLGFPSDLAKYSGDGLCAAMAKNNDFRSPSLT